MGNHEFGVIGLGTMGKSLLLNVAEHGYSAAGLTSDPAKGKAIEAEGFGRVQCFQDVGEFVRSIRRPRPILLLVPAGKPVDDTIAKLAPLLDPDDFIIDGGNSHFRDTNRRLETLAGQGFGFMGMGISGGERGARVGPSMMPGGTEAQYVRFQPVLESIAAKFDGEPCVARMGNGSAGHYVKMVHNGIEYGMMQAIAEVYDILVRGYGQSTESIAEVFTRWTQGGLSGFLMDITAQILHTVDPMTDKPLVTMISDKARAKGTGKWTSQDAMDLGVPVPSIDAAVAARMISEYRDMRLRGSLLYGGPSHGDSDPSLSTLESALTAAFLITYSQGLTLIQVASEEYKYETDLETVAKVWRAGCIIRSAMLEPIRAAFHRSPGLTSLLLDQVVAADVRIHAPGLRAAVGDAVNRGIPTPVLSASLAYLDSVGSARLPANLIQAQRDFFGAHTYERVDREGAFHTQWEE